MHKWWEAGDRWDAGWYQAEVVEVIDDLADAPGLHAKLKCRDYCIDGPLVLA